MITIFDPRGIDPAKYKKTYPELGKIEEFRPLNGKEMQFIWFFANKTSPFITTNVPPEARVELALKRSGMLEDLPEKVLSNYQDLIFPEHLNVAIKKMAEFNPEVRNSANAILIEMFKNMNEMKDLKNFKDKEGNYDMTAYANAVKNTSITLSSLVRQIEEGFGVKDVDEVLSEEDGNDLVSRFYKER